jgi:hypothetical protein
VSSQTDWYGVRTSCELDRSYLKKEKNMRFVKTTALVLSASIGLAPLAGCESLPGGEKEQGAVIGGVGGAAAGAAIGGAVGGPPGALIGGAIGAVAGGLAGKGGAEAVNPTVEDAYWRDNYRNEPYYQSGFNYDEYRPAYRTGWEGRARYPGRNFEDVERDLATDYERNRGSSSLDWERSRDAVRAGWSRIDVL